jgi:DNA-binding response OmpR family regulator
MVATVDDEQVELNLTEWDMLRTLTREPGVVVNYESLKQMAWGSTTVSDAAVHMAVRRLRQKLNRGSDEEGLIRTHRGIGYSISVS